MSFRKYEKYKDSGAEWLGDIPDNWYTVPLKYYLNIQNGCDHKHVEADEGYPVLGSGGIFACASNFLYDGETVLLGRKGTIDKPLYFRGPFWTVDTMYWSIIKENVWGKFAYYLATQIPFKLYSTSTALPSMTKFSLANHPVSLPPLAQQKSISAFLDRETVKIDTLIAEQQKLIELLKEKRQAVISHAVTKGLDPNVKMKHTGIDWMGEVPEHWSVAPFKSIIRRIESGTSVNSIDYPTDDNELGVLKTSCVYNGKFDPNENKAVLPEEYNRVTCPVIENTLIISRMNTPDLVGAAGIVDFSMPNLFLPDRLWQIHLSKSLPTYVYYWTLSKSYREQVETACTGTSSSMKNLSQDNLRMFIISIPPIHEQREIAQYLQAQLEKIDNLSSGSQIAIELLQERRSALISAAVTGKIDVTGLVSDTEAA